MIYDRICILRAARRVNAFFAVYRFGSHHLRHNYNAVRCYECVECSMISFHVSRHALARPPHHVRNSMSMRQAICLASPQDWHAACIVTSSRLGRQLFSDFLHLCVRRLRFIACTK